jgi:hypothetical protein
VAETDFLKSVLVVNGYFVFVTDIATGNFHKSFLKPVVKMSAVGIYQLGNLLQQAVR